MNRINGCVTLSSLPFLLFLYPLLSGCSDNSLSTSAEKYEKKPYTISITCNGDGSALITKDGVPVDSAFSGESVELYAEPGERSSFSHWDGDIEGTENPYVLAVEKDYLIDAYFIQNDDIIVSVEITGNGSVRFDPPNTGPYPAGTTLHVTAEPESGYYFSHWQGPPGDETPENFSMELYADITLYPVFKKREWLFMAYMNGDNNLEENLVYDIREMESEPLPDGVQIIVLADRSDKYYSGFDNWDGTRLYLVRTGQVTHPGQLASKRIPSQLLEIPSVGDNELNMGLQSTLENFIQFCHSEYPSDHYGLIVWGHGTGWKGQKSITEIGQSYKGVSVDESSNNDILSTSELGRALSPYFLDFIMLDICFGGLLEIAYEIRNSSSFMIASESTIPAQGMNYTSFLTMLPDTSVTIDTILSSSVESFAAHYAGYTDACLSAIDLSAVEAVHNTLNAMCVKIHDTITSEQIEPLKELIFYSVEDFYTTPGDLFIDLRHLAQTVMDETALCDNEASALIQAVDNAINGMWCSGIGNVNASGLAIHYVPLSASGLPLPHDPLYNSDYTGIDSLSFVKESDWVPGTFRKSLLSLLFY